MTPVKILVVNQIEKVRTEIIDLVTSAGHRCLAAGDGAQAIEMVKNNHIDLVIADNALPDMDGVELMAGARKANPEPSFIILTDYGGPRAYERIIASGAAEIIRKPFTGQEFRSLLQKVVIQHGLEAENRRLLRRQAKLNERLATLLAMAADLTAELDVDRLFSLIIGKVTEAMAAERTSLYVVDWENLEIWTKVAEQVGEIRLPLGQGISGRVAESGVLINVKDAWDLPYFNREFDRKHNFRTRSVLCMPIRNQAGDRIGVIQVMNKKGASRFTKEDETFLKALASQVGIALENSLLHEELRLSFDSSIRTLSATVDARHPLTAGHSQRVTEYSLTIARRMGTEPGDLEVLKYAALLHDIGKIGIRDDVLLKSGPFTPEEREEMNTHPTKTRVILEEFRFPRALGNVPFVAACHHEKVDGQGYPDGLTRDELPLGSRIMAVADVFDALTSRRDYPKYADGQTMSHAPMPLEKVIGILKKEAGSQFDPEVVKVFLECLPQIVREDENRHFPATYREEVENGPTEP